MPAIGRVTRQSDGTYKGVLATLSIRQTIQFVANKKANDSQPDYLILAQDVEVGAAWWRTAVSSGKEYLKYSTGRARVWQPYTVRQSRTGTQV